MQKCSRLLPFYIYNSIIIYTFLYSFIMIPFSSLIQFPPSQHSQAISAQQTRGNFFLHCFGWVFGTWHFPPSPRHAAKSERGMKNPALLVLENKKRQRKKKRHNNNRQQQHIWERLKMLIVSPKNHQQKHYLFRIIILLAEMLKLKWIKFAHIGSASAHIMCRHRHRLSLSPLPFHLLFRLKSILF